MIAQTKNNWKRNAALFLISQCITLFGSMIVQMSIIPTSQAIPAYAGKRAVSIYKTGSW